MAAAPKRGARRQFAVRARTVAVFHREPDDQEHDGDRDDAGQREPCIKENVDVQRQ